MEKYYTELYFGSVHVLVGITLFCSLLVWSQRGDGQRSRRFLAGAWFLLLFVSIVRLVKAYYQIDRDFEGVLPIGRLVSGLPTLAVMMIYPIEVVAPRWLNRRRLWILFWPVILVFILYGAIQFMGGGFRELDTMSHIALYWREPNVWVRFPMLALIYAYAFTLYYLPQQMTRGNTTLRWIRIYTLGNLGVGLFYMGWMLWGIYPSGIFHALYFALFVGYVTYQELYVRLFIPESEEIAIRKKNPSTQDRELWDRLEHYMRQESAWHNPSLSPSVLASALGATQAQLTTLIESMNEGKFDDYVAEFRIREFCALVDSGKSITVEDTFFKVGFRYRDVATKQFTRIMHQSPDEYMQQREKTTLTKLQ